jgi:hypothetical protein
VQVIDPDKPVATRTACVVFGATPEEVAAVGCHDRMTSRANRHGTLITGRPGDLVIDYAAELPGPVYDVMYNPDTGWFSVTVYRGLSQPVRWDNRPGTDPGYPRADDILGARTPIAILDALDVPAAAIGYTQA